MLASAPSAGRRNAKWARSSQFCCLSRPSGSPCSFSSTAVGGIARDVFLKINEYLTSEDILRGRYVLHRKVADEDSIENLSDREYRDIHQAITAFNTLGLYVKNGYLDEQDVLDIWAMSIYRTWLTAQPYIAHRERTHGYHSWAYFEPLAKNCQENLARKGEEIKIAIWRRQPPGDSE